jgi:hypothetical protein
MVGSVGMAELAAWCDEHVCGSVLRWLADKKLTMDEGNVAVTIGGSDGLDSEGRNVHGIDCSCCASGQESTLFKAKRRGEDSGNSIIMLDQSQFYTIMTFRTPAVKSCTRSLAR